MCDEQKIISDQRVRPTFYFFDRLFFFTSSPPPPLPSPPPLRYNFAGNHHSSATVKSYQACKPNYTRRFLLYLSDGAAAAAAAACTVDTTISPITCIIRNQTFYYLYIYNTTITGLSHLNNLIRASLAGSSSS